MSNKSTYGRNSQSKGSTDNHFQGDNLTRKTTEPEGREDPYTPNNEYSADIQEWKS